MNIKAYVEEAKKQYNALTDRQKYYVIGILVGSCIFLAVLLLLKLVLLAIILVAFAVVVCINYYRLMNIQRGEAYYEELKTRDLYKKSKLTVKDIVNNSKYDIYNKLGIQNKSRYDDYFEPQMRVNGEMYFAKGRVQEVINLRNGRFRALVFGREKYTVELQFSPNDDLEHMNCTCSGFSQSMSCKHTYATVYAIKCSGNIRAMLNEINLHIDSAEELIDESEQYVIRLYSKSPYYNEYMKNIKAYTEKLMELRTNLNGKNENALLSDVVMSIKLLEGYRKYAMSMFSNVKETSIQNKLFLPKFEQIATKLFKKEDDPYRNTLSRAYVNKTQQSTSSVANNSTTTASDTAQTGTTAASAASTTTTDSVANTVNKPNIQPTSAKANVAPAANPTATVAARTTTSTVNSGGGASTGTISPQNIQDIINHKPNANATQVKTASIATAHSNVQNNVIEPVNPNKKVENTTQNVVTESINEVGPRPTPPPTPRPTPGPARSPKDFDEIEPLNPVSGDMAANPNSHLLEDDEAYNALFKDGEKEAVVQFEDFEIHVKKKKK